MRINRSTRRTEAWERKWGLEMAAVKTIADHGGSNSLTTQFGGIYQNEFPGAVRRPEPPPRDAGRLPGGRWASLSAPIGGVYQNNYPQN